jgi:hypothetical protein
MIDIFRRQDAVASFAGVAPTQSFHLVRVEDGGRVKSIQHVKDVGMRVNGGFFVFRKQIFDWIKPGEELVAEPFQRLAAAGKLLAYPYDGFWACLDTFKDKQLLEDLYCAVRSPGRSGNRKPRHPTWTRAEERWMHKVSILEGASGPKKILALGAHADDIEIGSGGTILRLLEENPATEVYWVVLGASRQRRTEAVESANIFLANAGR